MFHAVTKSFMAEIFETKVDKRVIVTHHAPSIESVASIYREHRLTPCFASNLDGLIKSSEAAAWFHGHVHHTVDYQIGDTRVLCNPRGYIPEEPNKDFAVRVIDI